MGSELHRGLPSVAIVGGGFGGVGAAAQLKRAGVRDLVLFERAPRLGGVWHANTYPGAACDVPSALYSYSFAPNPGWSRRFAEGWEIRAYVERVACDLGVVEHARLGVEVELARFDEARGRWVLETSAGVHEADVLVAACGQLTEPSIPRIPGLDTFAGPVMHTARWDDDVQLRGRRIGVVGTGASAIQAVPPLAELAEHLDVFQIDPPWTLPKPDAVYGRLRRGLFERAPFTLAAERAVAFWVNEFGTHAYTQHARLRPAVAATSRLQRRLQVRDPHLRKAVEPSDTVGCKRVLLTNDWYPTLGRPDVALVTDPIVRIEPDGPVTADGRRHPADVLVLGTGFQAQRFVAPMRVEGRHGRTLEDAWRPRAKAHLGTSVPGFPNLFLLYGPNTNVGSGSVISVLEAGIGQAVQAVELLGRSDARTIEVRAAAAERFDIECQAALRRTVWATGCASWYLDADGNNANNWPWSAREYRRRLATVSDADFVLDAAVAAEAVT